MSTDNKKIKMWLSVAGVLLVIFLVWMSSIKYSIKASVIDFSASRKDDFSKLEDAKLNIKQQITEIKEAFGNLKATSTPLEAVTSTEK